MGAKYEEVRCFNCGEHFPRQWIIDGVAFHADMMCFCCPKCFVQFFAEPPDESVGITFAERGGE